MSLPTPCVKPSLRGVSHQGACVVALVAGIALVAWAPTPRAALAAAVYGLSLTLLFGISALYHRPTWSKPARARMRRLDHSAIFLLIAGTYTPFCMRLPATEGHTLLLIVWIGALAGVVQSIVWVTAPKILIAVFYLTLGWVIIPFLHSLQQVVTTRQMTLLAIGGVAYSLGAVVYAIRRPNPAPAIFGYHEIFHALTIVASVCHFGAVIEAVRIIA